MKETLKKIFFKTCPKTGKIRGIKFENKLFYYLTFPILGILATIWILVRVIPKPSRLTYPCMRVAVPISSTFLTFISGLAISFFSLKKLKENLQSKNFKLLFSAFLIICLLAGFSMIHFSTVMQSYANFPTINQPSNEPIGEAKGIFPGRVVWVHNADATNENCTMQPNFDGKADESDDGWFLNKNNDQTVIDEMLNTALREITGEIEISTAWHQIFKYYNGNHEKGEIGYQDGEKIFIKTNATSSWGWGSSWGNIKSNFEVNENSNYGISETSPQLILSLLHHLVDIVGVAQENIYIGDPMKHIYAHCYDLWHTDFPNIHYLDYNQTTIGREKVAISATAQIDYSDRGTVLHEGSWEDATSGNPIQTDHLYSIFEEMDYMINVPTLNGHKRAGMTAFAKNHFGSHTRTDAKHLHNGLIAPEETVARRGGYGLYRVQTDLMSHELLGQKNLIYLMDCLWSAGYEVTQPSKWLLAPFDNDWSSSIFISQDPVAIESVGYDFLHSEYTAENHPDLTYVQMEGVDEYLHHAADSTTWPEGIVYDPENDGTPISSQGVHEHWNNAIDRQYTQNLSTGNGIELVTRDASNDTQDDTVIVKLATELPTFDGNADELCWQNSDWQELGQTWIPWGDFVLSDDFSGHYKAVWNYENNVICFLVEIHDDVLVDGYTLGNGDYYNYDVLELFVDADNSGGMHRIDQGNENAENAFSYHINVTFPEVGESTNNLIAMDIAGVWQNPNYASHFENFCLKHYEDKIVYEFSLNIYDDNYNNSNPENSRVKLYPNHILGFSMAYCENDDVDENPAERDNFYGSVEVPESAYNSHWENADWFGTMKLVDEMGALAIGEKPENYADNFELQQNYPNPFNPSTTIIYSLPATMQVNLSVFNLTGQKVSELVNENQSAGYYNIQWNAQNVASGVYYYQLQAGDFVDTRRCLLLK